MRAANTMHMRKEKEKSERTLDRKSIKDSLIISSSKYRAKIARGKTAEDSRLSLFFPRLFEKKLERDNDFSRSRLFTANENSRI